MQWPQEQDERTPEVIFVKPSSSAPALGPTFAQKLEEIAPPPRDLDEVYEKYYKERLTRQEFKEFSDQVGSMCNAASEINGPPIMRKVKDFLSKPVVLKLLQLGKKL